MTSSSKNRGPSWLALLVILAGVLVAVAVGVWQYAHAVPRLHPDAQKIPSVAGAHPSPRWNDAVEKARRLVRSEVSVQNLPGVSVAVGIGTDVVWAEGFGWANVETHVPVSPGLRFRIGHASNALTSAAVGLLLERRDIRLDEEIQTYVPAFPKKAWPVTVRQLLGNVAGVRHYLGEEADIPSGHCSRASEGLRSFADDPLQFEPETQYGYSTYGGVLVSAAVESIAGEPFFDFMRTKVFAELGMLDTGFDDGSEPHPDRATFYFPRFSGDNAFGQDVAPPADYSCFSGAGAFLSTPTDLVRFGIAMNNGRLLTPDTVRVLQTPTVLTSGKDTDYGLGWMLESVSLAGRPTRLAGHASRSLLGASASFLTFPERGLVVAVTSNTSYANLRSVALRIAEYFAADGASR